MEKEDTLWLIIAKRSKPKLEKERKLCKFKRIYYYIIKTQILKKIQEKRAGNNHLPETEYHRERERERWGEAKEEEEEEGKW
jgi:hypothetical protein